MLRNRCRSAPVFITRNFNLVLNADKSALGADFADKQAVMTILPVTFAKVFVILSSSDANFAKI